MLKAKFLDCAEKFHRESHSKNLSIEDLENEELKFKQIDRDNRGYISWRDFMNYHSVIMLQKRSKVHGSLSLSLSLSLEGMNEGTHELFGIAAYFRNQETQVTKQTPLASATSKV